MCAIEAFLSRRLEPVTSEASTPRRVCEAVVGDRHAPISPTFDIGYFIGKI